MDSQRDDGSAYPTRDPRFSGDAAEGTASASFETPHTTEYTTSREVTEYRTEVGRYRRPLFGLPWIAGLILVPAILAGFGLMGRPAAPAPGAATATASTTQAATTSTSTTTSAPALIPFSMESDGKTVTLKGSVPDAAAKTAVLDAAKASLGTGVTVVDDMTITPGAPAVSTAAITSLDAALKGCKTYSFSFDGKTVNLAGVAPTQAVKDSVIAAAKAAYPGATVDASRLTLEPGAAVTTIPNNTTPTATPTPTPSAPAATCATASASVKKITDATKIQFMTGGAALTADSQAALAKIADAVKACADVKLLVAGNTDNIGRAATNDALSKSRAEAVKAQLVKLGVNAANITTVGNGSAKPIASNATEAGRQANRRVDITVQ